MTIPALQKQMEVTMRKVISVFSVFLLLSCTVGPDYHRPEFYSDDSVKTSLKLKPVEKSTVTLDWYRQFNDPQLNELVMAALQHNPNAGAAVERLRQARQNFKISKVSMFPTLDADGSYHYVKDSISYGIPISTDYFQTGLDASWELDIWGGGTRLTESALALVNAAGANLNNVRLSLTAEVASNYISLRQTQEQLRISRENQKLQQEIFDLVKEKYGLGLTDDIVLNQSQYLLENTNAQIPALEAAESAYQNSLAILTGQLPGTLESKLAAGENNLVAKPFEYDLQKLYQLPVDVIRRRPDVQAAEQNLISDNAQIGEAVAKLFPSVSLSGFLGYQADKIPGLVSSNNSMYSYSPVINLPLFHWGALVNNVELQKAKKEESLKLYQASILTAANDIRNSTVKLEKEYKSNVSTRQAWLSQKEVSDLTLDKYQQGLVDFSEVLTSQQNLLSSQTAYLNSNASIYLDIISFYKSVGGGYQTKIKPMYKPQAVCGSATCPAR